MFLKTFLGEPREDRMRVWGTPPSPHGRDFLGGVTRPLTASYASPGWSNADDGQPDRPPPQSFGCLAALCLLCGGAVAAPLRAGGVLLPLTGGAAGSRALLGEAGADAAKGGGYPCGGRPRFAPSMTRVSCCCFAAAAGLGGPVHATASTAQ